MPSVTFDTEVFHALEQQISSATAEQLSTQSSVPETTLIKSSGRIGQRLCSIKNERKRARESQLSQAERIVKLSRVYHKPGESGDNVTVSIPMIDRGRGDP